MKTDSINLLFQYYFYDFKCDNFVKRRNIRFSVESLDVVVNIKPIIVFLYSNLNKISCLYDGISTQKIIYTIVMFVNELRRCTYKLYVVQSAYDEYDLTIVDDVGSTCEYTLKVFQGYGSYGKCLYYIHDGSFLLHEYCIFSEGMSGYLVSDHSGFNTFDVLCLRLDLYKKVKFFFVE